MEKINTDYYMASSVSGENEPNPARNIQWFKTNSLKTHFQKHQNNHIIMHWKNKFVVAEIIYVFTFWTMQIFDLPEGHDLHSFLLKGGAQFCDPALFFR